jgi:hypothetical protein
MVESFHELAQQKGKIAQERREYVVAAVMSCLCAQRYKVNLRHTMHVLTENHICKDNKD